MPKNENLFIASTDTVTGIGAIVSEENRVAINTLKNSPPNKRLIILVSSVDMAVKHYSEQGFDAHAERLAAKYWPGATTLSCNSQLALRMPKNEKLLELIEKLGPIYMTSANMAGRRPLSLQDAKEAFPQIKKVYDFGEGSGKPSQIIDVASETVLRS